MGKDEIKAGGLLDVTTTKEVLHKTKDIANVKEVWDKLVEGEVWWTWGGSFRRQSLSA
jgi:hypothetical protein